MWSVQSPGHEIIFTAKRYWPWMPKRVVQLKSNIFTGVNILAKISDFFLFLISSSFSSCLPRAKHYKLLISSSFSDIFLFLLPPGVAIGQNIYPCKQSNNQAMKKIKQSINQTIDQTIKQSINQTIDQTIKQSINQSSYKFDILHKKYQWLGGGAIPF